MEQDAADALRPAGYCVARLLPSSNRRRQVVGRFKEYDASSRRMLSLPLGRYHCKAEETHYLLWRRHLATESRAAQLSAYAKLQASTALSRHDAVAYPYRIRGQFQHGHAAAATSISRHDAVAYRIRGQFQHGHAAAATSNKQSVDIRIVRCRPPRRARGWTKPKYKQFTDKPGTDKIAACGVSVDTSASCG